MGKLEGKVAVVSGAARGQGRSHAATLAREGADVVIFDLCDTLSTALTPGATESDLRETAAIVESYDRRCLAATVDARDLAGLQAFADQAMTEFGRIDLLAVNHGMWTVAANSWELDEAAWQESLDVLLTGAWKVTKAFIPKILQGGRGGSIVLTSSINGLRPQPSGVAYSASKAGVLNLMKVLAWELGEFDVRVNAVCPGGVDTQMVTGGGTLEKALSLRGDYHNTVRNRLKIELMPPQAISDAVLWLLSSDARYVTGVELPVDAGWLTF
ncbi:MAG: short-chain dehydrogenase [Subtercola sp.]|nr:short-chain dehydrogenase [Subtercola sp.]